MAVNQNTRSLLPQKLHFQTAERDEQIRYSQKLPSSVTWTKQWHDGVWEEVFPWTGVERKGLSEELAKQTARGTEKYEWCKCPKAGRAWLSSRTPRTDSECSRETATGTWKEIERKESSIYFCFWLEQNRNPWRSSRLCLWQCFFRGRWGVQWGSLAVFKWIHILNIEGRQKGDS